MHSYTFMCMYVRMSLYMFMGSENSILISNVLRTIYMFSVCLLEVNRGFDDGMKQGQARIKGVLSTQACSFEEPGFSEVH